jgi:uncharacterized coiled-coil protein SlyX
MGVLAERAASTRAAVAAALERVEATLGRLSEQRGESQAEVDAALAAASADSTELAAECQARHAALDEDLAEAERSIAELREAVAGAHTELERKQGEWAERLQDMVGTAEAQAEAVCAGVNEVLTRQTSALLDLGNHLVATHNEAMEELTQAFGPKAKERLQAHLDALIDKLEALGGVSEAAREGLGTKADAALGKVASALPVIEQVTGVLALAGHLG